MRNCIGLIIIIISIDILYLIFSLLIGYPLFPYPFDVLILIWISIMVATQLLFKKFHKHKERAQNIYLNNEQFTLKLEVQRKLTHLFILGLIFVHLGLGVLVYKMINDTLTLADALNTNFWGVSVVDFPAQYENWSIAIFGTFCAFLLLMIPEIFRIFSNDDYMFYPVEHMMRDKERYMPTASVSLSLASLVPVIAIAHLEISISAITIAIIGDAFASIVGRRYGKHKIKFFPSKSYEGLAGGMFFGFLAGFGVLIITIDVITSLLLALVGSIILGLIDLPHVQISDNILNPIIIGIGMYILAIIIYF